MFRHLIVPVDGSDVNMKSLKKVAELAKADGAKVTLVYVSDPLPPIAYADSTMGVAFTDTTKRPVRPLQRKFWRNVVKNWARA